MAFAGLANTVLRPITPAKSGVSGIPGEAPMWEAPVKASTTVTVGDVLIFTAGYLEFGAAAAIGDTIVGIAAETLTTTATVDEVTDVVRYYPALPGMVFIAHMVGDESGDTDETAAFATIGTLEGLSPTGVAGLWVIDQAGAAAGNCVRIKDFALQQIHGGGSSADHGLFLYDRNTVVSKGVRNPLVEFVFVNTFWSMITVQS